MVKHKKKILANISPENRLTVEQKLKDKGYKFQKIQLTQYENRAGIMNCPEYPDVFILKEFCKHCKRWLGASGSYYLCKIK